MKTESHLFIADVHLGKLARLLRMLGFDTWYENSATNAELIAAALEQQRVLLTKNTLINKRHSSLQPFIILHDEPFAQLQQVLQHFQLFHQFHPFSRCLVCNGTLHAVLKEVILPQLPENTGKYYSEFWQCLQCSRIYWKGPHYNRMMNVINAINQQAV